MRQAKDAFHQLEEKIDRLLRDVSEEASIRECLDVALEDPGAEVGQAAKMRCTADMLSKYYGRIKTECDSFLRHALPAGTEADAGGFHINHYTRRVFDKTAWEHWAKSDPNTAPLFVSAKALEQIKKDRKAEFEYLDSSVRVTPRKEAS